MSRREQWAGFDHDVQLRLAADSIDHLENQLVTERAERKAADDAERQERKAADKEQADATASSRQVLVGILASIVVAAVMLAINLAVTR